MMIGHLVMKWQQFLEIQDGGVRHFEFFQLCISDVIDMFQIVVPMSPLILVTIGQIIKKMAAVFRNARWRRPPS